MFSDEGAFTAYRVGLGSDLWWLRGYLHRRQWSKAARTARRIASRVRSRQWWVLWQCEYPDTCRFARRGFTAKGAERRMRRDATIFDLTGAPSLWQTWRTAKADGLPDSEVRRIIRARTDALLEDCQ